MEKTEIRNRIYKFIDDLPEYTAGGMSINDIKYDGIPIWWFFKAKFREGKLPLQLPEHRKIVSDISINKKITILESVKNQLKAYLSAKFIRYNEELKIFISRFNKKQSKMVAGRRNIMFLVHTNAIMFDKSKTSFEVDRIGSVVRRIIEDDELQEYISVVDPISHNSLLKLLNYENLIYKYMNKESRKEVMIEASKLNKRWKTTRDKFQYNSEMDKEIYSHLQPALNFVFSKEMIYFVILYYETYKKIIRENDIKLLIVYAYSGTIIRCAIMASDKLGIKTLQVMHGIGKISINPQLPDSVYHAVIAEKCKEDYINSGILSEKVFITGPIFMDDIIKYKKSSFSDITKNILFLTWPIDDFKFDKNEYIRYITKYIQELNKVGNINITIKLHPRERDTKLYELIVNSLDYKNIDIIKTAGKTQTKDFLYSLIRDSDLVISFGSTVSVESLVIGTPTLIIDLFCFPQDSIMAEGIIHAKRNEDISRVVAEMLYNKKKIVEALKKGDQVVKKYLYKVDGKANERVMEIIKELIF